MLRTIGIAALFASALLACPALAQPIVIAPELFRKPITITVHKQIQEPVTITAANRPVTAEMTVTEVTIRIYRGSPWDRKVRKNIISVFDPASGLFWWAYQDFDGYTNAATARAMFLSDYRVVKDESRLVGFAVRAKGLWIRTSIDRFENGDEATGALLSSLSTDSGFKEVMLWQTMGMKPIFPAKPGDHLCCLTKITDITRDPGAWLVTVENVVGEPRIVVLDDSFYIVSIKDSK